MANAFDDLIAAIGTAQTQRTAQDQAVADEATAATTLNTVTTEAGTKINAATADLATKSKVVDDGAQALLVTEQNLDALVHAAIHPDAAPAA